MGSKSLLGLPKLIFGEDAYFVGPANEIHTFCILKSSKIGQNELKMHEMHNLGKTKASEVNFLSIFHDFGGPQGRPKISKNEKKCLPKIDRKKAGKKGGDHPRPGRGSAAIARPEGMQDSCSGRFLP